MNKFLPTGEGVVELLEAIGKPVTASTVIEKLSKLNNIRIANKQSTEFEQNIYDILTVGVRFGYIQRKDGKYYLETIEENESQEEFAKDVESITGNIQNSDVHCNNDYH